MGKTRSEIQKAYRKRKKQQEGEAYLAKERRRRMTYYVPSSELTTSARTKRNKKNSENLRKWRRKKKQEIQDAIPVNDDDNRPGRSGDDGALSSCLSSHLIVRMDFQTRTKNATRVRTSRALAKHTEI
jgi:hypothetical protein